MSRESELDKLIQNADDIAEEFYPIFIANNWKSSRGILPMKADIKEKIIELAEGIKEENFNELGHERMWVYVIKEPKASDAPPGNNGGDTFEWVARVILFAKLCSSYDYD